MKSILGLETKTELKDKIELLKEIKTIGILGNANTGKTALVNSLSGNKFNDNTESTMGVNFTEFQTGNHFFQIIDFSGQNIYEQNFVELKKAKPIIILLSISSRTDNIIEELQQWKKQIDNLDLEHNYETSLIITKTDMFPTDINEYRIKRVFPFANIFKTSSKSGDGIQQLRSHINKSIENEFEESEDIEESSVIQVVNEMIHRLCELIARNKDALNQIEWRDLERIISESLSVLGFEIELTNSAKDGGKDVIARCRVKNEVKVYYIEIKHWRGGNRVGSKSLNDFINVNINDETSGGLFVSSSGYTNSVYECLGEIKKQEVRLGTDKKIVSLCQKMIKKKNGIWYPKTVLPELLFEQTL